ncbi:MAG: hypothetical protein WD801_07490 [Gemmatimonadaceae bacterium]
MARPPIPYSQIRNTLQTGDVVTFQGKSALDYMIQLETHTPYNHVGMIIRLGTNLYFWDAPGGGKQFPDPYTNNQPHAGTRVAPLDDLLGSYMQNEVAMYVRQVQPALGTEQLAALSAFISVANGIPFPGDHIKLPLEFGLGVGLAASYAMGRKFGLTHAGHYFCAHLIADTYMHMGLLPIAPLPANGYAPSDFDAATLPLIGHTLTDVVQVTWDKGADSIASSAGNSSAASARTVS